MAMMFYTMLSLVELPEPDWNELPERAPVPKEIGFELDEHLRQEVQRVRIQVYAEVRKEIVVFYNDGLTNTRQHNRKIT